jgi:hypothetical protein
MGSSRSLPRRGNPARLRSDVRLARRWHWRARDDRGEPAPGLDDDRGFVAAAEPPAHPERVARRRDGSAAEPSPRRGRVTARHHAGPLRRGPRPSRGRCRPTGKRSQTPQPFVSRHTAPRRRRDVRGVYGGDVARVSHPWSLSARSRSVSAPFTSCSRPGLRSPCPHRWRSSAREASTSDPNTAARRSRGSRRPRLRSYPRFP